MKRCAEEWRLLAASQNGEEEQTRARAFSHCARANKIVYTVALRDPSTGADIPVADLDKHTGMIEVRVTVEDGSKQEVLSWKARGPAGVYPLLAE
jgi:hypothetical protein